MRDLRNNLLISTYDKHFKTNPAYMVSAPGRINLIGEHTDYTEGFVLPVAIDRDISIAFSPRDDQIVRVYSLDFDEAIEIDLTHLEKQPYHWAEYINGMAWSLIEAGYPIMGWQGVMHGNIPVGAGLSSSAAFEVAVGKAFCVSSQLDLSPTELALLAQNAERNWVGVNVGIMDQLISSAGNQNCAMLLDCKTLVFEYVPIPENISLVVMDTLTRRELTHSAYNTRHAEVKQAIRILGVNSLRDLSLEELQAKQALLPGTLYRRVRHIVSENKRVHQFVRAMRNGDVIQMGTLINASHASLRDNFEVSSEALDLMVSLAQGHATSLGARMMGAGFGGCALALVKHKEHANFIHEIGAVYHDKTGVEPNLFQVKSADGASLKSLAY